MGQTKTTKTIERKRNRTSHRAGQFGVNITHRNKCRRLKRHLRHHPEDQAARKALSRYS